MLEKVHIYMKKKEKCVYNSRKRERGGEEGEVEAEERSELARGGRGECALRR